MSSPAQQPQQGVVEHERKLKAKGDAEHQEEREVRRPEELPEKCRQDTEQRRCAQHQADDGLEDDEQEQRGQADALPKEPENAPKDAPDEVTGGRCFEILGAPYRIRTGVTALRGLCPGPLDEGSGGAGPASGARYYREEYRTRNGPLISRA
jgi:hypothetical protein